MCVFEPLALRSSGRSLPGEMDETDALRSKRCTDDTVSLAPSTTESIIVEGELGRGGGLDSSTRLLEGVCEPFWESWLTSAVLMELWCVWE